MSFLQIEPRFNFTGVPGTDNSSKIGNERQLHDTEWIVASWADILTSLIGENHLFKGLLSWGAITVLLKVTN